MYIDILQLVDIQKLDSRVVKRCKERLNQVMVAFRKRPDIFIHFGTLGAFQFLAQSVHGPRGSSRGLGGWGTTAAIAPWAATSVPELMAMRLRPTVDVKNMSTSLNRHQ